MVELVDTCGADRGIGRWLAGGSHCDIWSADRFALAQGDRGLIVMIYLYSGTPGSGKSLHQARDIRRLLRQRGRLLVTNYPLDLSSVKCVRATHIYLSNDELTPSVLEGVARDFFAGGHPREGAIKLYIDEAQLLFNARTWNEKGRRDWLSFFSQHRKFGFDVFLVAQFDLMIDRQIRSLIEYEVQHRAVGNYGMAGWLISMLLGGGWHCAISRWYAGRQRLGASFFRASRHVCAIYNTWATFNGGGESSSATAARPLPG